MKYYEDNAYQIEAIARVIQQNRPYFCTEAIYDAAKNTGIIRTSHDLQISGKGHWVEENDLQTLLNELKVDMDADEFNLDIRALFDE